MDGIGPEHLKIQELVTRLNTGKPAGFEVILATNPSLEGETTAMYLLRLLKPINANMLPSISPEIISRRITCHQSDHVISPSAIARIIKVAA